MSILIADCTNACYRLRHSFIFRIKLIKAEFVGKSSHTESILLRRLWCWTAIAIIVDGIWLYQYLNKLPIYHAEATATEKKTSNWKWKMMMVRVCVCVLSARCASDFLLAHLPRHNLTAPTHCFTVSVRRFSIWLRQFEWLMTKIYLWGCASDAFARHGFGSPSQQKLKVLSRVLPFRVIALIMHFTRWFFLIGCLRLSFLILRFNFT